MGGSDRLTIVGGRVSRPALRAGRRAPPARVRNSSHGVLRSAFIGCVAVAVALGTASLVLPPAHALVTTPLAPSLSPNAAWIEIEQPLRLFALSGSPFAKLPALYAARRRPSGIERQDILTFGQFGEGPYLHLAISRLADNSSSADLVVDYARIAATDGLALLRAGLPTTLPTRFGGFAVADLALNQGKDMLPCLGFRLDPAPGPTPIAIVGAACGTAQHPIDRAALACALDRLDLIEAGSDTALRDVFVEAERRRGLPCGRPRTF